MLLTTVNTQKGLSYCTRLPFGVASASTLFQHCTESKLQGLAWVLVCLENVIISEKRVDCTTSRKVLQRFREFGVQLHPGKANDFDSPKWASGATE